MKIKFDDLPEGFEVRNGEIVEVKKTGGTTGDQKNYGLVTGPQDEYEHEEIKVKYSMSAVPRDEANIEAEGGETVLTDLNDDGNFGLYDIKGSRHANGGVPLYLPEQSFVFSDFNKMKLTKDEMKQMGVNSKKRLTPAKVSKKYGLNEYYASLKDPFADDIQAKSAELMLDKNKMQLSKLAFIQEAKKDFEEGVPVTAFPFLAQTGYDPIEYTQQVEDITRQQAQQKYIESLPPEQQMQLQALQQYMAQVDEQEQEMIDANTEQGALPPPTNMGVQQGMMPPPPEMDNQQLAQMGFEVEDMSYAQDGYELIKAQRGRNFKEREEREEREAAYYKEKEAIDSIPKQKIAQYIDPDGGWTYTIWQDSEGNKYQREEGFVNDDGIFVASSDDFSGHGGWITDPERIAATENDENLQKFRGDVPKNGQVMDEGWDENIITETSDDNKFDSAVDKLDKVTAKDSNRKYYPTNNLRTVVLGQINNPANPFNPLQDFIPLEELETPEKSLRKILNSDDIFGEITKLGETAEFGEKVGQLADFIKENPELTDKIIEKNYPIIDKETLLNTLDDVEVSFLYGSDIKSKEKSLSLYREDFNKNIEALKAKNNQKQEGNTSTSDQSPQTGNNQATKQEAKEFLDDPDGTNQSNTNVTTPSLKRNATATVSEDYTEEDDIPVAKEDPINKVFLGNTELLQNYRALERTFKDPNSPAAKALVDKFRKGIDNDDYFGKRVSREDREKLRKLSPQEIVDYFLLLEKRNLGAYAHELAGGKKISEFAQTGDPKGEYKELYEKMGMSYDDATDFPIAAQQLSYIAYRDLLKDRDAGNLTDAQSKALQGFGISQVGKKDEAYNIDPENDISRSDKYGGNTTLGQQATYTPPNEIPLAEKTTVPVEEATVENEDKDINIQPNQLKVPYNPNDPRFWLQDLLKLNAIANRKRGKFYPWQPAVEDIEVDWVLEDPTRAIAAANEQMNIMAQGLGTFGGPQSFNARMSNIQGKNAANVANIIAGVHNRNVNTTNRGLAQQAQFDYYIDKENRARNTKLYDDTMKVEQNALIEENFDREQYADALANAYTNMANTYNMNTLYDNYNIDPTTGGMVYFTNPTALDPSPYSAKSKMDKYFDFGNEFRTKFKREPTEAEIKYFMGIQDDDNQMSNYQREARAKGMGSGYNRGYDYTGQRGREINKLLPFFTGQVGI